MNNKDQYKETVNKLEKVVMECLKNPKMRNELFPNGEPDAEEFIMTMASIDIDKYYEKYKD